jgi:hypothetical protein
MEIIGNDNRIRALFSEDRIADVQATSDFISVWRRAEARSLQPRQSFSFSLAVVTVLAALTLGSLGLWSIYQQRSQLRHDAFAELKAADKLVTPQITAAVDERTSRSDPKPVRRPLRSRASRSFMRNDSLVAKNNDAKATSIDRWQSPTATLLTSTADGLFKSLPQLNENANELKSFLPTHANEKEK